MSRRYKPKKSKLYKDKQSISWVFLLPIFFIIGFVPLIVYAKLLTLDGLELENWLGNEYYFDFFSYYKAITFSILSFISLIIMIILIKTDKIYLIDSKYYYPMGIYLFFVIISFFFADDFDVAVRGYIEMFQGVFVLFSYIIMMFVIINLVRDVKSIKILLVSFVIVGLSIGIIGLGQYFGYDIFKTEWGQLLILPKKFHVLASELKFKFADFAVYGTLYNTNFVGSFASLMIPLSFALYFYQKKVLYAFLSIIFVGLMIFIGFGSNSRAGIIGVIAALILIMVLFRHEVIKKPMYILLPFATLVILGASLNRISDGRIVNEIRNLNIFEDIAKAEQRYESRAYFEEIIIDDYNMKIITNEDELEIEFISNELYFYDIDGNQLETINENGRITFIDPNYQNYIFSRGEDSSYYLVQAHGRSFNIWLTIDGFKFQGLNGDLYVPSNPRKIDFLDKYESMFSSRVYVWSRSIPMLLDYPIIGAGPDMYTIAFPQDDYAGKLNTLSINTVVEKPHNMYIQMAVNTGLPSLLAMLALFSMYLIESSKIYFRLSLSNLIDYLGVGFFASVTAYLISGFFNDQIISVAPLFYAMLALGIVVNQMILKRTSNNV